MACRRRRIARIAERAPANQRMIYAYYGNKDGLFDAVLQYHVLQSQATVTMGVDDLPGYAQQVFDFYRANPHFMRLALWQHLERPNLMQSLPAVSRAMADKVAAIERAQADGIVSAELNAARLLDHISALVLGNVHGHPNSWSDDEREDLARSVTRLIAPALT
jgi:AcrR family transcriptional regulator